MIISNLMELDPSSTSTDQITYKLASTRAEREAAFRLIYRSYLQAGLTRPNEYEIRITPYHLQSSTAMFVAKLRDEVVSTVSLVCDDKLGLPISRIYADEVEQRRRDGMRIGEVTCLADRRKHLARRIALLIGLFRLMVQYSRREGLDQLLIAVHPRHAAFYQRLLAFQQIGEERAYAAVLDNPAVAFCWTSSESIAIAQRTTRIFLVSHCPKRLSLRSQSAPRIASISRRSWNDVS